MRAIEVCKKCDKLIWFFAFTHQKNDEIWRFKKQRNGFYEAHGKNVTLRFMCVHDKKEPDGCFESTFCVRDVPHQCSYKMEQEVLMGGKGQTIFEEDGKDEEGED